MIPLFIVMYIQLTTSIPERIEYPKNLLNSGFDWPVEPSAIFSETESAARLICEVKI